MTRILKTGSRSRHSSGRLQHGVKYCGEPDPGLFQTFANDRRMEFQVSAVDLEAARCRRERHSSARIPAAGKGRRRPGRYRVKSGVAEYMALDCLIDYSVRDWIERCL